MLSIKIQLNTTNNAALFIASCQEYDCEIDLLYGRYIIDAKSILGVFSIPLDKECIVILHSDDQQIVRKFMKDMELWTVEVMRCK